jgi:CDP-4-dehydro-6-deoxyglucose reductase
MEEHRIQLLPTGHSFSAVEQETLLEAALRSGININYHCASGSCGDCQARLISGELRPADFHDYRFTAAQKAQGHFLLCTAHAASDLVIEAGEANSARDIPLQEITARVVKVEGVSEYLRILHLNTPRTNTLRFLAGQHVALTLPGTGSLDSVVASCPCNGRQLQFHIPHGEHNPFVRTLFDGLRYGSEVVVTGPFGEVTLQDDAERPLLMIAQDHGLAAIKSLVEHAINRDVAQPVRLFWLAHDHYLDNHCRAWGEALDDYSYTPLARQVGTVGAAQAVQLFTAITRELNELGGWDIYLAGETPLGEALQRRLVEAGADAARIFPLQRRRASRPIPRVVGG